MKYNRLLAAVLYSVLLLLTVCGCGDKLNGTSGKVATDGSTSMEKVIGFLKEAFEEQNKNVSVSYNPTGSSAGIAAVKNGACDIGLSGRALNKEEKEILTETVIALDGIVIAVNSENPVTHLTVEQVAKLYKGEIVNWKELGGNDSPVVLIGREASSGTRDGFESVTETKGKCKYNQELTSSGDIIQTVASNPNAVGYASMASVKSTVKILKIDGVEPNTETIQSGAYKIQRRFTFVTRSDRQLSNAAKAFLGFAASGEADDLIVRAGAVPVKRG